MGLSVFGPRLLTFVQRRGSNLAPGDIVEFLRRIPGKSQGLFYGAVDRCLHLGDAVGNFDLAADVKAAFQRGVGVAPDWNRQQQKCRYKGKNTHGCKPFMVGGIATPTGYLVRWNPSLGEVDAMVHLLQIKLRHPW